MPKKLIFASAGAAGVVALLAVLDMVLKVPFRGAMVLDIMFLVAAGVILYMSFDTFRELN